MKIKKFAAILLAVVLTIALTVPAFAAATPLPGTATDQVKQNVILTGNHSGDLYINNTISGDKFAAYKIINITYNEGSNTLTYAWAGAAAAITAAGGSKPGVSVETYCGYGSAAVKDFLKAVQAEIVGHPANYYAAAASGTAGSSGLTFSDLGMGQYLIVLTESSTANTYELMTANIEPKPNGTAAWTVSDADVYAKGSTVTIEKDITNGSSSADSYDLGDTVNFMITLQVPKYDTETAHDITLYATDNFPAGLTLNASSIKVYGGDSTSSTALIKDTNYTLDTTAGSNYTFKVDFSGTTYYNTIKNYTNIYIVYSGTVNGDATLGNVGNPNGAKYTFTNDPTGGTSFKTVNEKFYTYSLDLYKYTTKTVDDESVRYGLADAYFTLYRPTTDGTGTEITTASGTVHGTAVGYLKTNSDGHGVLYTDTTYQVEQSLKAGSYYLVETKAPSGYVLLTNAQPVTLGGSSVSTYIYNNANIENTLGVTLPATGGIGTTLFQVGGVVIILLAGVFLVINRKKVFGSNK